MLAYYDIDYRISLQHFEGVIALCDL